LAREILFFKQLDTKNGLVILRTGWLKAGTKVDESDKENSMNQGVENY